MMAEDHFPDVVLVEEALRARGIDFRMDLLRDGNSALEYVAGLDSRQAVPDLMILDLNLSQVTGLDVLREIRKLRILDAVPVAILTSSLSSSKRGQAIELKVDAFIPKPSHLKEFLATVGSDLKALLDRKFNQDTKSA